MPKNGNNTCTFYGFGSIPIFGFILAWFLCAPSLSAGLELLIEIEDVRIEQKDAGAAVLVVKKHNEIQSLLITEATDSRVEADGTVYTYWAEEHHPANGDEARILNEKILITPRYYLADSTAEPDEEFGTAFRIRIPCAVQYGFSHTRQGTVSLTDETGLQINIRAFEYPYADYRGAYRDNPFVITATTDQ